MGLLRRASRAWGSTRRGAWCRSSRLAAGARAVEGQQARQDFLVGYLGRVVRPAVGGGDRRIQRRVRLGKPGRAVTPAPAMPRQGQAIAAVGAPNGWGFSLSAGIVSRYGEASGMFQTQPMMQIDAPVTGGNSGGPVFNARGEAVGMVSFGKGAFNQAVPIGQVLEVADRIRRSAFASPAG
ncbi:serine protease [Calidifontimicrobium sp. SYSU G02091]|uniref:S1 family peptidase n=1 Tax=Calidifontimicrobium sp. SYSU G02091 TaxID=2926421 RepID=UPI001F536E3D|nr:serine protease [Calidifontimicrobium sp. SYSU G02091]MCI1193766.1 serine protease [Calidifontimicrobium sp. SYSU G02091]